MSFIWKNNMKSRKLNHDGNRLVENDRLVYYKQTANKEYWEDLWLKETDLQTYLPYKNGKLFTFEKIFSRHLPKNGMILEAGCGPAQLVLGLNVRGYNCIGLDYAFSAMRRAIQVAGPLRLMCGDITALGLADESFSAIISIGVVEHRRAGPEPFLEEMYRIIKPGGTMLISVPYFNPLRRWRAGQGAYQDDVSGLDFYQNAFTRDEFCQFLEEAGFQIEKTYSYAHQNTLTQELHWLKKLPVFLKNLTLRISKHVPYVNSEIGHMLMVVARKRMAELI